MSNKIVNVLVTGGAGFIGGALIRKLLMSKKYNVFNLDKLTRRSDLSSINQLLKKNPDFKQRYKFFKADLLDLEILNEIVNKACPDLVFHLAAESHVDRSIDSPKEVIENNILGTYNLLESIRKYFNLLNNQRKNHFRFHHISTDEVFGSLGDKGRFNESSIYDPRSPYSASKASSDHLVSAWFHTYGIPSIITNCSNNYGNWQFLDKLIPLVILKSLSGEPIPIYGDGMNVRDWLHVDDHIDALLLVANNGEIGQKYLIGGSNEKTNKEIVISICNYLDLIRPKKDSYKKLIMYVSDRPGHDYRYSIDSSLIREKLGWTEKINFEKGLEETISWYLDNLNWCKNISSRSGYIGQRLGQL